MGFCYDSRNRLVCDNCGTSGGVRKVPCKYGYCPPNALCAGCRTDSELKARIGNSCDVLCKPAAEKFKADEKRRAELLAVGEFIRVSASSAPDGLVKVTFRNAAGETIEKLVTDEVYRAVPLTAPASVGTFDAIAALLGASTPLEALVS